MKFKKILRTDYFRVTQNLNHYIGIFVQSSNHYISSEKNVFIKRSMGMNLKYVEILVAAKKSVKFRRSIREIPKNRSKFSKNAIFYLFFHPVQTSIHVAKLLDGFCWEYLDASKMLSFVMIGAMQTFCQWVKLKFFLKLVNFEGLQKGLISWF